MIRSDSFVFARRARRQRDIFGRDRPRGDSIRNQHCLFGQLFEWRVRQSQFVAIDAGFRDRGSTAIGRCTIGPIRRATSD